MPSASMSASRRRTSEAPAVAAGDRAVAMGTPQPGPSCVGYSLPSICATHAPPDRPAPSQPGYRSARAVHAVGSSDTWASASITRCDTIVSIPGPTNSSPVGALGISEDQQALHDTARRWVERRCPPAVVRRALEAPHELPPFWGELAELGWLGLHVGEAHGGSGGGLGDLAVVLEELGRACAPGPFLPTVLASAVIDRAGSASQRKDLLPGLVDGSTVGAVAWSGAVEA